MKVNVRKLNLVLLIVATIIPSYWFVGGRKLLNLIYYATTFLFFMQTTMRHNRLRNQKYDSAGIFIFSLFMYCVQALFDSGVGTAINSMVSTVLVVIIMSYNVKDEYDFNKMIDGLLGLSVPLLILAVIEAVFGYNVFQKSGLTYSITSFYSERRLGILRVSSVFGHPIVYCNYLSIVGALCIYRLSCKLSKTRRRRYQLIYALTVLNVLLTVSRSVMLVFIAEQIVLLAIKGERWLTGRKLIALLCVILGALVSEFLGLGILDKVSDIFNMILQVFGLGSDSYSSAFSSTGYSGVVGDRWNIYLWVILAIAGNWAFGQGTTAAFSHMASQYREKTSIENYYLSTLFHHGIVGLVVLVIGLVCLAYYLTKQVKECSMSGRKLDNENKLTFNATMLCVLYGEIISYFMVDQAGEARLFYVCIGLALAYNRIRTMKTVKYSGGATS